MGRLCGGDLNRINPSMAFRAKDNGDVAATILIDEFIKYLSMGTSNIINIFQPDIVCIGGGISSEGEKLVGPLRESVKRMSFGIDGERTRLETAHFLNDAGIIGGALLGLQENFG
jgi:glucokinase